MTDIRLGVIGLGMIGRVHATHAAKLRGCHLVAVSDVDPQCQGMAGELGVKYYSDYHTMLENERLDGVVVAVPNHLHAAVGMACAQRRVNILMEKPIAPTLADADRLIDSVKQHRVQLLIGHHRRFNAAINVVREIIRRGEIGQLVGVAVLWAMFKPAEYFDAIWRKKVGGGPILINVIHEIDNLRYVCGEISRVYAEVSKAARKFEVEDSASISVRFVGGALASILISDCSPSLWAYEATTGENPFFSHSRENCYHILGTDASLSFPHVRRISYAKGSGKGWQYPTIADEVHIAELDPYEEQLKHFCAVIRGEETPRTSGDDARQTLAVTLAVARSGETGQPIMTV